MLKRSKPLVYLLSVATAVFVAAPVFGQIIPDDKKLEDRPDGSVVPTMRMAEQIRSCLATDQSGARALVQIDGMDDAEGNVRIQVYGEDPEEFLEKGKQMLRIDVPAEDKDMQVCVTFPTPGRYAMVVMHDRNANGRADVLTEGFGFSRNPRLLFSQPDHDEVAFDAGDGLTEMSVSLTYMFKLKNKDRKTRRRH